MQCSAGFSVGMLQRIANIMQRANTGIDKRFMEFTFELLTGLLVEKQHMWPIPTDLDELVDFLFGSTSLQCFREAFKKIRSFGIPPK